MSVAFSGRRTSDSSWFASGRTSEDSLKFSLLVSVAIVAIGLGVAIYALAVYIGFGPELALMSAYP
jgi:uncharacterized membrane protein YczE